MADKSFNMADCKIVTKRAGTGKDRKGIHGPLPLPGSDFWGLECLLWLGSHPLRSYNSFFGNLYSLSLLAYQKFQVYFSYL